MRAALAASASRRREARRGLDRRRRCREGGASGLRDGPSGKAGGTILTQGAPPRGIAPAAANGLAELANALRMGAMRLVSRQRGDTPRAFVLVALGEAGPLHTHALARALDLPSMLMLPSPGIASARGRRMTDVTHACVATRRHLLACLDPAAWDRKHTGAARLRRRRLQRPAARRKA